MQKNINALWQYFSSIKLAIVLLTIITMASIIGTLIPQQDAAREFLQGRSALVVSVFNFLQLGNLFRSAWFITLLGVFSLNLIVCSWNRFPAAWKLFRRKFSPGRGDAFRDSPPEWRHQSKGSLPAEIKRVEALMKKKFRRVGSVESGEGIIIHGEKGALSYLGAYIIHAGILVIIVGALLGIFFGFKGYVNIMEGESVQVAQLISGKGVQPLGFTARCDKFIVEFYETKQPKLFRSDMTFTRGDQVLAKGALMVNHP
ncbi:MAG: cytochrome c biogenesis protein ResB, partial [Smithellaceae bacterium]|nr:cytochrome c biogenesis protein ResB [Smithellaceae bacterium]